MARPERRVVLTGESPVRVSAGAPGSRLRLRGEIRATRRSVKSPCKRGEQTNGLQRTSKQQSGQDVKQIIVELTPVLRGWGNYFRTGNADREFNKMDSYVLHSLRDWQYRRGGQRATKRPPFTRQQLSDMGLHQLMGTVKYPAQATPRRSSLSRVPENGMHGLKGGPWKRTGL